MKLKTSFAFLLLLSAPLCAQEFPIGIWFSGNRSALDSVSAMGFTWVQAYCGWDSSDSRKNYEYILRNPHGLKVIAFIEKHLHNPSFSQRLVYEAEQPVDSSGVQNYFARKSETTGAPSGKFWQAIAGEHVPGYLAKDPFPNDLLLYGRREWVASFRMKIDPSGRRDAPVVRCEIARGTTILAQKEVREKDFNGKTPRTFEVRFTLPSDDKPAALDVRVWWHARVNTYLDYVVWEDFVKDAKHPQLSGAYQLFRGDRDAEIVAMAKRFASRTKYPLVQRFYLKDEPHHSGYQTFRYVDQLIRERARLEGAADGRGRAITATPNYTQGTPQREASFERFLREAQPHELFVDAYPVHADIPADTAYVPRTEAARAGIAPFISSSEYNAKLQGTFDYMIINSLLPAVRVAQRHEVPWWYIAQAHGELCEATGQYRRGDNNGPMLRTPSPEEMRAMVYLALAYGAKGIFYFAYATMSDRNFGGCKPAFFPGLIARDGSTDLPPDPFARPNHSSNDDAFAGRRIFTGYQKKYEGVRALNAELNRLGPLLLPLAWEAAFSVHRLLEEPLSQAHGLHDVTTASLAGKRDAEHATYVEVGVFKKAKASFYLIVNRRGDTHGSREVTVTFQGEAAKTHVLTNLWDGTQQRFTRPRFSYKLVLGPGEGALLQRHTE
ncbi:hypothetical protein HUU05_08005 [candidate division KSB1 bacterium]|nr:hypothetical protein [candidate division KSB1 bacterium]